MFSLWGTYLPKLWTWKGAPDLTPHAASYGFELTVLFYPTRENRLYRSSDAADSVYAISSGIVTHNLYEYRD